MFQMWIIVLLIWLSVEDWKEGLLSLPVIMTLGVTGWLNAVCTRASVCPWIGIVLLIIGKFSKERIGYGDGWLLTALGMWLLPEQLLMVFFGGVCIGSVWALLCRKKEIPLVPFMTIVYVAGLLI